LIAPRFLFLALSVFGTLAQDEVERDRAEDNKESQRTHQERIHRLLSSPCALNCDAACKQNSSQSECLKEVSPTVWSFFHPTVERREHYLQDGDLAKGVS
jgi:hypothetical protein